MRFDTHPRILQPRQRFQYVPVYIFRLLVTQEIDPTIAKPKCYIDLQQSQPASLYRSIDHIFRALFYKCFFPNLIEENNFKEVERGIKTRQPETDPINLTYIKGGGRCHKRWDLLG